MRAFLTAQSGPLQGEIFTLEPGTMLRFGRKATAEVSIPNDRALSGVHFAIMRDKSRCRIRDLNSTNGTFVNGIRANLVELFDRDVIRAGSNEFEIRFEGMINSTVIDPLVYPEISKIREAQTNAQPDEQQKVFKHDSTEFMTEKVEDLGYSPGAANLENASNSQSASSQVRRLLVNFQDGSGKRQAWLSPGETIIVGRNQMADVTVVGDASISGVHFALDCEADKCRLRDLKSQNGTQLNQLAVPYATIYDGDQFLAGQTEFKVTIEGGASAPDAAMRTWVFEDMVRRNFATFFATSVGENHHRIDAIGPQPAPIELVRRLARNREIEIIVHSPEIDRQPWTDLAVASHNILEEDGKPIISCYQFHDIERVVDPIRKYWESDALSILLPQEMQEDLLKQLVDSLNKMADPQIVDRFKLTTASGFLKWLGEEPSKISQRLPEVDAVFTKHPEPDKWRILAETDFISILNGLGYLPAAKTD